MVLPGTTKICLGCAQKLPISQFEMTNGGRSLKCILCFEEPRRTEAQREEAAKAFRRRVFPDQVEREERAAEVARGLKECQTCERMLPLKFYSAKGVQCRACATEKNRATHKATTGAVYEKMGVLVDRNPSHLFPHRPKSTRKFPGQSGRQ